LLVEFESGELPGLLGLAAIEAELSGLLGRDESTCGQHKSSADISEMRWCVPPRSNMPPEDRARFLHMIEATQTALNFVAGRQRADLDADQMLLFAVVGAIEVIGQAAGKIIQPTRRATPEIPWGLVVSMRNRLIHAYFDVDHEVVWKTATLELPGLLPKFRALVQEH
jgi:uncharacterized protein with HEPN domain